MKKMSWKTDPRTEMKRNRWTTICNSILNYYWPWT
jgi:hypothetical protein